MPHTERARKKARAEAKARRALVDPNEERPVMPGGIIPSEDQMLAALERRWGQGQSAGASRCLGRTHAHGASNGNVSPRKQDY